MLRQGGGPFAIDEFVAEVEGPFPDLREDGPHGFQVARQRAGALEAGVDAMAACRVQEVAGGQQDGGLARLPGAVQDEVLLAPDEGLELLHVQSFQGRNDVVVRGDHRTRDVEEAHDWSER